MVDEFSSFARMPSASMKSLDLNEILRQAVFLQRVGHPEIEYKLDMPGTPVMLECDGRLVSQALTNILKNAAEAIRGTEKEDDEDGTLSPKNAAPNEKIGRIHVELLAGKDTVTSMTTDSGCGLPDADRSRLTEPYMTTRAKGTGLGLAIVNKVMEDHGGELLLEDAPLDDGWERGARVKLVFPRQPVPKETQGEDNTGSKRRVAVIASKEAANGV